MKKIVGTILGLALSTSALADTFIEVNECTLEDGKTAEELQAKNAEWLAWMHRNVSEDIRSDIGTAVVGNQDIFLFVDTFPSLAVWAEAMEKLDSDAGDEIDDLFEGVSDCTQNRLWKMEPTS